MNISTKSVIDHMKEQVRRLEQAHMNENTEQMKEAVSSIEAYCQLFKGTDGKTTEVNLSLKRPVETPLPTYHQVVQPYPTVTPSYNEGNETKPKEDNLLDF
ncbi:YwdI family protein [Alkalihalobacillus sp. 1P02AB]|uniref:YwdI family protein n=1 Tax=Alkalihalobacillus sp. 1P02AB TaxID=3132260 RepID=UPI0039A4945B